MPEPFTIQGFASKGSKPNPHGGVLHKWEVSLDDEKGETHHGVYWQSKSDELHIGQEVYGEISDGEYGPRFRTAQREDGAPRASQGGSGNLSKDDYWKRKDQRDVESQARQGRAHAQEMAIRWLALQYGKGPVNEELLWAWIDQFHRDVQRFPLDADVGGGRPDTGPGTASAADVSAKPEVRVANLATEEASAAQKRRLTQEFNRLQLAREAQKAIVLFRCRSEKATKDGASQLIKDITEGATAESLLAEISDGRRAGNPLAARAAALIPTDIPNAEPPEEPVPANGDEIPF